MSTPAHRADSSERRDVLPRISIRRAALARNPSERSHHRARARILDCVLRKRPRMKLTSILERAARKTTQYVGGTWGFAAAVALVIAWLLAGPIFHYSDTWQLAINTTTTIVTFLMVFLIQRAQNKDAHAMQLKLNELIAAQSGASNRLINIESLTEDELDVLNRHYAVLVERIRRDTSVTESHSVEEAVRRHDEKYADARAEPKASGTR
jgi:low affinity Fe/Cu permease